jgi:hypothetical protein
MLSVNQSSPTTANPSEGSASDPGADAAEVPHSPGSSAGSAAVASANPALAHALLPALLGPLIALATLVTPFAIVLGSRQDGGWRVPVSSDGPQQPAGVSRPRTGESAGGDSSRQPQ